MYLGHGNRFVGGHLHTIGNRCWCGYLALPVGFHTRDDKEKVVEDGKGEERYLAWLGSDEKPDYVNPPVMEEVLRNQTSAVPVTKSKRGGKREGAGRPKVHTDRQTAYRERKAG